MAEYWIVLDKDGDVCAELDGLFEDPKDAATAIENLTQVEKLFGPHRVVHLVEAGFAPDWASPVDPEVAKLVQQCVRFKWLEDKSGTVEDGEAAWIPRPIVEAVEKLKPHQLRACGIEVDDA